MTRSNPDDLTDAARAALRAPFPPEAIGKLPRKTQGGGTIQLDYVGHAAVTDRLLAVDPYWSWEPCGFTDQGLPVFDQQGGLWIKLTVCGVTRLGYGDPGRNKGQPDGTKEAIGDAIRNAAMRFGVALDLWHKGDLQPPADEARPAPSKRQEPARPAPSPAPLDREAERLRRREAAMARAAQRSPDDDGPGDDPGPGPAMEHTLTAAKFDRPLDIRKVPTTPEGIARKAQYAIDQRAKQASKRDVAEAVDA